MLLTQLRGIVFKKVDESQLGTLPGISKALVQLQALRSGEVVGALPKNTVWRLRRKITPGSASVSRGNEQWACCRGRAAVGAGRCGDGECSGTLSNSDVTVQVNIGARHMPSTHGMSLNEVQELLMPNWPNISTGASSPAKYLKTTNGCARAC